MARPRSATLLASLLLAATLLVAGCNTPARTHQKVGDRDHLVGWYNLPIRSDRTGEVTPGPHQVIPILKRGAEYRTVGAGYELPLEQTETGLQTTHENDILPGAVFEYDAQTDDVFVRIFDGIGEVTHRENTPELRAYENGLRCKLERIDRPAWLRDPTAPPPDDLDDFLGSFEMLYLPLHQFAVGQDRDGYYLFGLRSGVLHPTEEDIQRLTPLPDGSGFEFFDGLLRLRYNPELQRFELDQKLLRDGIISAPRPLFHHPRVKLGI